MRARQTACCLLALATAASCAHVPNRPEKTCLVLSVGGTKGLAHLGAIDALKEKGVRIDCVYPTP